MIHTKEQVLKLLIKIRLVNILRIFLLENNKSIVTFAFILLLYEVYPRVWTDKRLF